MSYTGVINKETHENFDPIKLIYTDHSVCYPDQSHFLYVVTPNCKVLYINEDRVWLAINSPWVCKVIDDVDINFVQHRCRTTQDYMEKIMLLDPSLKLSPSTTRNILVVKIHTNTEQYGAIDCGDTVRTVLSANYHRSGIVWSVIKIKRQNQVANTRSNHETEPDFLQECQLKQSFIKI